MCRLAKQDDERSANAFVESDRYPTASPKGEAREMNDSVISFRRLKVMIDFFWVLFRVSILVAK
jgi:hypothetical protein